MNRNSNAIFGFVAAAVLILSGCINNVDTETGGNSNVPDGKCSLTVDSGFSARAAFPSSLAADMVYAAEISYSSSGGATKWLGADSVESSPAVLKNSPSASGEIRFVFCAPEESAEYTITVFACPSGTSVGSATEVENAAAASGQAGFSLEAGQKALETPVKVSLSANASASGTGSVKLPLSFDFALGIVAAKVNVTKDGVSDSSGNNYEFEISVSESGAALSAENVSAGTYLVIMKFYKSTTDFSSSNEVVVNSAVQQVSVYSGMTTDCWFVDGKKHGTASADGTFTRSALELTKYDFTELYVCGTDGGGEYGGKRSFYVFSNFGSSVPAASDTDGDGSMAKPFATVQKAVDKIAAANDTSKKYTVYVDGTVTADTIGNYSANNSSFVNISPASMLNLAIKSLSTEKAVIDGGRSSKAADTTGWRIFYIGEKAVVTFENITITGGSLNDAGGGISCDGNLTLKNCIVAENKSNNAGGGISFGGEELVLENTDVLSNQTEADGGGISVLNIYNSPKVTISGGKIKSNKSSKNGGAINSNGIVTISGIVEILNNSASKYGGGIYFWGDGEKTISDTTINQNSAEFGGGIYMQNGTLNLKNGSVIGEKLDPDDEANDILKVATSADYGNKSTDTSYSRSGAGLYVLAGTVNMSEGSYICKNYTSSYGGGVYVSQTGTFNMSGGVIGWNFSRMGGGIIADGADASSSSYSVLDISGTAKICYNEAGFTSAQGCTGRGAGIFACGDLNISGNAEIFGNYAEKSGAGIHSEKKIVMTGGSVHDNEAKTDGAGIYIYSGEAELSSCTIKANKAGGNGGAIYANSESSSRITVKIGKENSSDDVLIEKNNAKRGGAFYGANNADFVMNAGKVSENYSTGSDSGDGGGAMFIWGGSTTNYSTFTMNGGEISGNMAKNNGCGGAVHIDHGTGGMAAFIMTGGVLSGNKAADENGNGSNLGGAIYVKNGGQIKLGGSAVIAVSEESDNCNDIYLADGKTITVTDTLTPGNNAAAGNPKYTARITPESYTLGTTIIQGEGELDSSSCAKFLVTANAADELKYKIKYDSSSKTGKLATTQNIVIDGKEYENTALEDVIDTATTITGSGKDGVFIDERTVTLSPYSIGKYEVTQELFEAVMGENPSSYRSSPEDGEEQKYRPVEQVNGYHAIVFCNKLSKKLGLEKCYKITSGGSEIDIDNFDCKAITAAYSGWTVSCDLTKNGYRLPTAAEWEFAARGGNRNAAEWKYTYAGSNNVGDVAWYNDDGDRYTKKTHQVGLKNPNSLGLYDMSGNVFEICWDFSSPSKGTVTDPYGESGSEYYRPGGGFGEKESGLAVTKKYSLYVGESLYGDTGFRLARSGFPRAN